MSMGIGHHYWVEVIKFKVGDLKTIINFINENQPTNDKEWIDLQPGVKKNGTCTEYCVSLVKLSETQNKKREKHEKTNKN